MESTGKKTLGHPSLLPLGMYGENLLLRARRLDSAALAQIHDRYYPEVYRYLRFRLDDEAVCEDLASEVFLRLLDALNKGGGPAKNLRGWLFGTVSNLVNDHLRSAYAHRIQPLDEDAPLTDGHHPERSYEQTWHAQQLRQALLRLTPEQQHVLALRFAEEYSLEETANVMGKTITAVKQLQFRAVASLRRLLEERFRE